MEDECPTFLLRRIFLFIQFRLRMSPDNFLDSFFAANFYEILSEQALFNQEINKNICHFMRYLTKDIYIVIICHHFYMNLNGMFVILAAGVLAGAMTITSLNAIQEASAAKDCTADANNCYCYSNVLGGKICFGNKGECQKAQREDQLAS